MYIHVHSAMRHFSEKLATTIKPSSLNMSKEKKCPTNVDNHPTNVNNHPMNVNNKSPSILSTNLLSTKTSHKHTN